MNRLLATAANSIEADIILSRLADAGIHGWPMDATPIWRRGGGGGACDIYVEEADLDRARRALEDAESVGEAELIALSEQSPPPPD